ncbi:hypothetical protein D9756_004031 [Leucocoprinus leucothites]|uniref:Fibronectin type-III domain-containing protein n=1 Tax=Leucocoprinus leucothites TaxID=201217 RepID=A0A8H5D9J6_9AGAR|nr:hypothetical protein D9756_004031 [Leucoagaricus leucothites]
MLPRRSLYLKIALFCCQTVSALYAPFLEQSFFFDWNDPTRPFPLTVTQQCETIHITWGRGTATGPNPVAPYYLQVYTSNYLVPFVIAAGDALQYDWTVPFAPGTQYQICMFDANGNTGGCQDVYTMIPSNSSPASSCTNVTVPVPLQVDATVANGPMSQYGWIEQCTDISLLPRNGTPPYIMTVAPSLHPPYNITGDGSKPMNWTVSMSWASSFFVSVSDSAGNVWSNGLLHSAEGSSAACLSSQLPSSKGVPTGATIGAGVGGLGVGLVAGLLGALLFLHLRGRKHRSANARLDLHGSSYPSSPQAQGVYLHAPSISSHYQAIPGSTGVAENSLGLSTHSANPGNRMGQLITGSQYHVEPFVLPTVAEDVQPLTDSSPTHHPSHPSLNSPSSAPESGAHSRDSGRQVYVVHHDGGRAPVTVYTQEGTQVVELPPGYPGEAAGSQLGVPQSPSSRAGQDVRSIVGSTIEIGSGSSDTSRMEAGASGGLPATLQQIRKPGDVKKPGSKRPRT